MNIKLLNDNILIEPITERKIGNIYLPDISTHMLSHYGKVVAVGNGAISKDGKSRLPVQVKVGDIVFYRLGAELEFDNKKYILVREDALVCVKFN
jgi:chaperonin GroES